MLHIPLGRIKEAVAAFTRREASREFSQMRERSWDICHVYFHDNPEPTRDIERAALHLMSYLASWGMYRGSTWLFKNTNVSHLAGAIRVNEQYNSDLRG